MIIYITGTPGTGKSTVSRILKDQTSITLVDVNSVVEEEKLYTGIHEEKGYKIVDIPKLCSYIGGVISNLEYGEDLLVEGHLSHFCDGADRVVVLRAHPDILRARLKEKGFKEAKINENLEAEALDVCTIEAYQKYGDKTSEIDTTGRGPHEIVDAIRMVLDGEETFPVGGVDFSDYFNP